MELRKLDRIGAAHLFRTVFRHKTMLLSAKYNGKVRVATKNNLFKNPSMQMSKELKELSPVNTCPAT